MPEAAFPRNKQNHSGALDLFDTLNLPKPALTPPVLLTFSPIRR